MIENMIDIDTSKNKYTFDYLTCFEKPLALALSRYGDTYHNLFLLYLKMFQSYNTTLFGKQELYIFNFETMFKWIVDKKLNLQLTIQKNSMPGIHEMIEKQINMQRPVLITANLKDLYYSKNYQVNDWRYLLLINGFDADRQLYSIIDTTSTEFDAKAMEGELYKPFVIEYQTIERLYESYQQAFDQEGFICYIEEQKKKKRLEYYSYVDCFSIFLYEREKQPFKELNFINEISESIEKGKPLIFQSIDGFNLEMDFVLTRYINYREVFYNELLSNITQLGVDDNLLEKVSQQCSNVLKKWSKIKTQSIIFYQLKKKPALEKLLNDVLKDEDDLATTISMIKNKLSFFDVKMITEQGVVNQHSINLNKGNDDSNRIKNSIKNDYRAPENDIEKKIADIWKDHLKIDRAGITDNFFDLGGHSLTAVRIIAVIIKEFNVELPLELFFKTPYIKEFAEYVKNNAGTGTYSQLPLAAEREYYPLSSAQKRLFIVDQLNASSITYNVTIAMEIKTNVDKNRVEKAFIELINRHDVLRTIFIINNGIPMQRIVDHVDFAIEYACVEMHEVDEKIKSFVKPFDLFDLPMIRVLLLQLPAKYMLIFDVPHIIIDGVSVGVLLREFSLLYNEENKKQVLPLLKIDYKDYCVWQESVLRSEEVKKQEKYWLKRFRGDIPILNLPLDYPRPTIQNFEGDTINFTISKELTQKVHSFSKKCESTLYMVLFAAFNILLSKYTNQDDVIVGSPVADRPHVDLHKMLGMFVNMMPIRNFPAGDKTCEEFLGEVKENALDAYRNQDCQFEVLVEKLGIKGSLDSNPLFNVVFALQNIEFQEIVIKDTLVNPYQIKNKVSKFDLLFEVLENSEGIDIIIEYSTTLFKRSTIERFGKHYLHILEEVIHNPQLTLSEIQGMSSKEVNYILYDFNNTERAYSEDKLIHQLFEEQVENYPENIAVEFKDVKLSYKDLNGISNCIAITLRKNGVKRGDYVAIIIDRSIEMIEGVMAILKAGGAYIPLEPYLPDDRIKKILDDLDVQAVITNRAQFSKVSVIARELPSLHNIFYLDIHADHSFSYDDSIDDKNIRTITKENVHVYPNPDHVAVSEDIAYIIFTSGSTGVPKGVVVQHKPVINIIQWVNRTFNVGPLDKILFITSLSFDLSVYDIFGILGSGATIHLQSEDEIREPKQLLNSLIHHGITFWDSAPPALQQLVPFFRKLQNEEVSKLRLVFLSGDWIPVVLPDQLRSAFKGVQVISLGGATEAAIWSNFYPIGEVKQYWPSIPYGKPIQNAKYYILDKALNPCPIGVAGDLYIGGRCLASGYAKDPELSARKFINNPFVKDEKMYKTGDLARWLDDGNMEFLGRVDHQVKIRSFRIELGEIESNLLKHKLIKAAIVLAKGEEKSDKYLIAYFIADKQFTVAEIKDFLADELPDYMIPSYFVQLDSFPLNANGKLDRKALAAIDADTINTGVEYVAPKTDTQVKITKLWKEVLKKDIIGINDNFFDIGGTSLTFIEVNSKLNKLFNMSIPVIKMFQYPTIRTLEHYIHKNNCDPFVALSMESRNDEADMNICQLVFIKNCQKEEENIPENCFFIHTGFGNVNPYLLLCNKLHAHIACWGLIADKEYITYNNITIEKLAEMHCAIIHEKQPEGPYNICGYCLGGTIAFEIARQLELTGQQVNNLLLISAGAPEQGYWDSLNVFNIMRSIMNNLIEGSISLQDAIDKMPYSITVGLNNPSTTSKEAFIKELMFIESLQNARESYFPKTKINSELLYIKADEITFNEGNWLRYCENTAKFHVFEGDHESILKEPTVDRIALLIDSMVTFL